MPTVFTKPTVQQIMRQMNINSYLPNAGDLNDILKTMEIALDSMEQKPTDHRLHVTNVHKFMKALWQKYDCEEIYNVLDSLTKVEPALLDLERDPEAGKRYRDHYVHVFHVFVLGLRIISSITSKLGDAESSHVFKVRDEVLDGAIKGYNNLGEQTVFHDYSWKERLFFLWTLMSTLHDLAIPITHLDSIRKALNSFSEKFHLEISGPVLMTRFPSDVDSYLWKIGRLFEGKFEVSSGSYKQGESGAYLKGYLERLIFKNHGVLSGYLTYKMIEEIFLQGKSNKYKLDVDSFEAYRKLILNEDIARASLAICLHDIGGGDKTKYPSFMPFNFDDYPLTFILILSDTLQEYLRWEGTTIRGDTKLLGFPTLKIKTKGDKIAIEICFSISEDLGEQVYFCQEVERMMKHHEWNSSGNTVNNSANDLCRILNADIGQKINLGTTSGDSFRLSITFFEGRKSHLCTQTLRTDT